MHRSKKIIIVSQDDNYVGKAKELFTRHGYEVQFASSDNDALKLATHSLPDIIIAELAMVDIDGLAFCSRIRRNIKTHNIAVLLIGDLSRRSPIVIDAINCGANGYEQKPVTVTELLTRTEEILAKKDTSRPSMPKKNGAHLNNVFPIKLPGRRLMTERTDVLQDPNFSEGYCRVYRGSEKGAVIKVYLPDANADVAGIFNVGGLTSPAMSLIGASDLARKLSSLIQNNCEVIVVEAGEGKDGVSLSVAAD